MSKIERIRKNIRVPENLDEQISEYQMKKGISSWTAALLELARRGLDEYNKENEKSPLE